MSRYEEEKERRAATNTGSKRCNYLIKVEVKQQLSIANDPVW